MSAQWEPPVEINKRKRMKFKAPFIVASGGCNPGWKARAFLQRALSTYLPLPLLSSRLKSLRVLIVNCCANITSLSLWGFLIAPPYFSPFVHNSLKNISSNYPFWMYHLFLPILKCTDWYTKIFSCNDWVSWKLYNSQPNSWWSVSFTSLIRPLI